MSFLPNGLVAYTFLLLCIFPIILFFLGKILPKRAKTGQTFLLALGITLFFWGVGVITAATYYTNQFILHLITSTMLITGGLLVAFTLWSIVVWGFTVSLLLALNRVNKKATSNSWINNFTDGEGLTKFSNDRLGVLIKLKLLNSQSLDMHPTRLGRIVAFTVTVARVIFGLRS